MCRKFSIFHSNLLSPIATWLIQIVTGLIYRLQSLNEVMCPYVSITSMLQFILNIIKTCCLMSYKLHLHCNCKWTLTHHNRDCCIIVLLKLNMYIYHWLCISLLLAIHYNYGVTRGVYTHTSSDNKLYTVWQPVSRSAVGELLQWIRRFAKVNVNKVKQNLPHRINPTFNLLLSMYLILVMPLESICIA